MLSAEQKETGTLGGGYRAIALHRGDQGASLRLCLIVQQAAEAVGGPFVLLRDLADASVYLGCIMDAAAAVREWTEISVQNVEHFTATFAAYEQAESNRTLDARWARRADAIRQIEPETFISAGWETQHPLPIFFDLSLSGPVHPIDKASGKGWELCLDDALLKSKGLPEYSQSLVRYLSLPDAGADVPLLPVTSGAPENEATERLAHAVGNLVPFNPAGGLMMVRSYAPIALEEWIDILSGKSWKGVEHGKKVFKPTGLYRTLQDPNVIRQGGGHLFLGRHGRAGQIVEGYHLKLHLLAAAVRLVRAYVQAHQVPFLNINAESFRVRLADSDPALPFLWNFKTTLVTPGEAIALPIESTELRYFVPARFGETSIYRPNALSLPVQGRGSIRIRKVLSGNDEEVSLEGTLTTQEKLAIGENDLLRLRLALPSGRIDLYANLAPSEGAAPGEARFRTVPQRLSDAAMIALREAEGVPLSNVSFETLPLLSTPCDLYALGVLAVRALLVDEETSLPIALDEMLSLARQVAAAHDPTIPIEKRVAAIASADPQRGAALGPHRLIHEKTAPEEAVRLFPSELWWDTISLLVRFFPGLGPDSLCRDFGDAPALALEAVFDEPLAALEKLIVRSRSLIVIDWNANREMGAVIRKILSRHGGGPPR